MRSFYILIPTLTFVNMGAAMPQYPPKADLQPRGGRRQFHAADYSMHGPPVVPDEEGTLSRRGLFGPGGLLGSLFGGSSPSASTSVNSHYEKSHLAPITANSNSADAESTSPGIVVGQGSGFGTSEGIPLLGSIGGSGQSGTGVAAPANSVKGSPMGVIPPVAGALPPVGSSGVPIPPLSGSKGAIPSLGGSVPVAAPFGGLAGTIPPENTYVIPLAPGSGSVVPPYGGVGSIIPSRSGQGGALPPPDGSGKVISPPGSPGTSGSVIPPGLEGAIPPIGGPAGVIPPVGGSGSALSLMPGSASLIPPFAGVGGTLPGAGSQAGVLPALSGPSKAIPFAPSSGGVVPSFGDALPFPSLGDGIPSFSSPTGTKSPHNGIGGDLPLVGYQAGALPSSNPSFPPNFGPGPVVSPLQGNAPFAPSDSINKAPTIANHNGIIPLPQASKAIPVGDGSFILPIPQTLGGLPVSPGGLGTSSKNEPLSNLISPFLSSPRTNNGLNAGDTNSGHLPFDTTTGEHKMQASSPYTDLTHSINHYGDADAIIPDLGSSLVPIAPIVSPLIGGDDSHGLGEGFADGILSLGETGGLGDREGGDLISGVVSAGILGSGAGKGKDGGRLLGGLSHIGSGKDNGILGGGSHATESKEDGGIFGGILPFLGSKDSDGYDSEKHGADVKYPLGYASDEWEVDGRPVEGREVEA